MKKLRDLDILPQEIQRSNRNFQKSLSLKILLLYYQCLQLALNPPRTQKKMIFSSVSLTPILSNSWIASRLWTPNWRNGVFSSLTLVHTFASSGSRLLKNKNHYKRLVLSCCSRSFSWQATALSHTNSNSHAVSSNG